MEFSLSKSEVVRVWKNKPEIVAVIPARGGSKGVPKKNLMKIGGITLLERAIRTAEACTLIDSVWVSTEDPEIRAHAHAHVLARPIELASENASSESALLHFAENVDFDILVFIQCTSPLTLSIDIRHGIEPVLSGHCTSTFSAFKSHQWIWKGREKVYPVGFCASSIFDRPMRQVLPDDMIFWIETGAFYVTTREDLLRSKCRVSGWVRPAAVSFWRSFQVDSEEDVVMINRIMRGDYWEQTNRC